MKQALAFLLFLTVLSSCQRRNQPRHELAQPVPQSAQTVIVPG